MTTLQPMRLRRFIPDPVTTRPGVATRAAAAAASVGGTSEETKEQRYYRLHSTDVLARAKRRYDSDPAVRERIVKRTRMSRFAERMLDWWRNEWPKNP